MRSWFEHRVPAHLGPRSLDALRSWRLSVLGPERNNGDSRPDFVVPLINHLERKARVSGDIGFNALWRERAGGRVYVYAIPEWCGELTMSRRTFEGFEHKHLLSAMHREVRAQLVLPPGFSMLEADFRACHPAIGCAVSGDAMMRADVDRDIHQVTGDGVLAVLRARGFQGDATQERRRELGKTVNCAMLFGCGPGTLGRTVRAGFGVGFPSAWEQWLWRAWWCRYPALAALRNDVQLKVQQAQRDRCGMSISAPSGWTARFSKSAFMGRTRPGRLTKRHEDVWKTVFAAAFRAIEGDLLFQTFRRLHASNEHHGGHVLPVYDGFLYAAAAGSEAEACAALIDAGKEAADDLGITTTSLAVKRVET